MKKLNETKHSMKMMSVCVAFAAIAIVLLIGGVGAGALFIIPCMLMMWMMVGGADGNSRGGPDAK